MTRMGVALSLDKMTPMESFYPRTECLPWSCSILGLNDTPGVVLSQDRTHPLESLYPSIEGPPGDVPSQDRMTPLGSFYARTEGLHRMRCTSIE